MLNWQKAVCPICGESFSYLPDYKPNTCGKHECLYKYFIQGGEEQKLKEAWRQRQLNNLCRVPNQT